MKYYLITAEEAANHTDATDQSIVYALDNSKCIIEVANDYDIPNHISVFNTPNEVNDWRWDPNTEEWRNWMTEEERNGEE